MFRVLHLIETSEPGGAETVLAYIAKHLPADRFSSEVYVLEEGWLTDHLRKLDVSFEVLKNRRSYDPAFLFKLMRLIRSNGINLIHAHEFMMTVYGSVAAKLTGRRMISTIHGKVYFPDNSRRIRLLRLGCSLSSCMVAVSKDLESYLRSILKPANNKLTVLYNGIDIDKYSPSCTKTESRQRLGIENQARIAITVGSLFEIKGLPHLLEAASILKKTMDNFLLLIVGEGDQEQQLQKKADSLGLGNTVRFLGFRTDIPEILRSADVYVCSSLSEGHSLSILEAMSMSIPVVATDVGGNPELIKHGHNGLLVPSEDPMSLAKSITKVLEDPTEAENMGKRSRLIVEDQFSLNAMVNRYVSLYDRILER